MNRYIALAALLPILVGAVFVALNVTAAPAKAPDVLIIEAGGTPFEAAAAITAANVDAVTCPTPVARNCKSVAGQVADALRAKGLDVRVIAAEEVKDRRDLVAPRVVVLASPTYFGNVSWRMHKVIDERLWPIFAPGGERLAGHPYAVLTIGRAEANAKSSADFLQSCVKSANGKVVATMTMGADTADAKVQESVATFAAAIEGVLKEAK